MKRINIIILSIAVCSIMFSGRTAFAQSKEVTGEYQRSALYMTLLKSTKQFSKEIRTVFYGLPVPDKFYDHDLSVKLIPLYSVPQNTKDKSAAIGEFLADNDVARRIVAKWFMREKRTGYFNTDLVTQRGLYNATELDRQFSSLTKRGEYMIQDSGEELVGSTFVIVNDIQYVDKERNAKVASKTLRIIGAIAGAITGSDDVEKVFDAGAGISDLISGFTVDVTSYLFQMEWNREMADGFYNAFWCDPSMTREEVDVRKESFDTSHGFFNLKYVGQYSARSAKTVLRGLNKNEDVIRKVCARALDKNIVELQKSFDQFKVKVPISKVDNNTVSAYIGMREGVDTDSKYEVLERSKDKNGVVHYKRVGTVQPVKGKIWDNRFMAVEEEAEGSQLGYTTFKVLTGAGKMYPGLLLREMKFK